MRALFAYLVAAAVLVVNPLFACNTTEPAFRYELVEIEQTLAGTWHARLTEDGTTRAVTFRIEAGTAGSQSHAARHLVRPAAACSERTLVRSAAACLDITTVPLRLIALDGSTLAMSGTFVVRGTRFERGDLGLELGGVRLFAEVARTGDVMRVRPVMNENIAVELVHGS